MKVLIIGSGGREHAMAWQVAQSDRVNQVFVAPGNAGTALEPKIQNVPIGIIEFEKLISFVKSNDIELTIVGPEVPLSAGIVDEFNKVGLQIFGPCQKGAQLESSKSFCKDFFKQFSIPTADYAHFTDIQEAKAYVQTQGTPIVIKADGLAAGKGVIIAQNESEAFEAIDDMLENNRFGYAGNKVVIESFLTGEEASYMVMVDGLSYVPLASSQDHKARDNFDKGPNTGGMGAYSPAPVVTPAIEARILKEVIEPTLEGLKSLGIHYQGFLYAGLMISPQGDIKVLEYNCRMGDPETQPILMRLKTPLADICINALNHQLEGTIIQWDERAAVGVVLASKGYPEECPTSMCITYPSSDDKDCKIFHAGTKFSDNNEIISTSGRVLSCVALGENVRLAKNKAYGLLETVQMENGYFRTDIADKAIDKTNA